MTTKQPALIGSRQKYFTSDDERERAVVTASYKDSRLNIFIKPPFSSIKRGEKCQGTLRRGSFNLPSVTCFVACGHCDKIEISNEDRNRELNLVDRLDAFIPPKDYAIFGKKDIIGLVTYKMELLIK